MSQKRKVFLDKDIVNDLATIIWHSRPRGILGLESDWSARYDHDETFAKPRSHNTIYNWLNDGVPGDSDALLGLASMLDVDPLVIFDYERNGYFDSFSKLREQVYFYISGRGQFRSILELLAPRQQWPNDMIAKRFYRRPWFAYEFEHRANDKINAYADIQIRFKESTQYTPRCVHVAYRRAKSLDKLWRFYGTVQKFRGKARLFSESGAYVEETQDESLDNDLEFKTYFGATHVEFRIVSLHEFEYGKDFPSLSNSGFIFEPDPRH